MINDQFEKIELRCIFNCGDRDITEQQKTEIKKNIVAQLKDEPEIRRIVIFGSFLSQSEPGDIDIAIFQNSKEGYLPLALKYRKKMRKISRQFALDIIPVKEGVPPSSFLSEINLGEQLYER